MLSDAIITHNAVYSYNSGLMSYLNVIALKDGWWAMTVMPKLVIIESLQHILEIRIAYITAEQNGACLPLR